MITTTPIAKADGEIAKAAPPEGAQHIPPWKPVNNGQQCPITTITAVTGIAQLDMAK